VIFPRSSGILLHPTSLPSRFGIGDLGPEAFVFANFLYHSAQQIWQVLPLGPTGYGDSPYQCFSAFAGNPLLVSFDLLLEQGYLHPADLGEIPPFPQGKVDYGWVIHYKLPLLKQSFERFRAAASNSEDEAFKDFCRTHDSWLEDFALFMAVKAAHTGAVWTDWPQDIALRRPAAIEEWKFQLAGDVEVIKFTQFLFFRPLLFNAHQVGQAGPPELSKPKGIKVPAVQADPCARLSL